MHYVSRVLEDVILLLSSSLPLRSIFRFVSLIVGVIVRPGHVTDALIGSETESSWSEAYKWLLYGKWSYLNLSRKMADMVSTLKPEKLYLAVDDTVIYRGSKKAPCSKIHHEYGNKSNRPTYVRGQNLVFMIASIKVPLVGNIALPLLSRLTPASGNSDKLKAVKVIWRVLGESFKSIPTYVLMDSWFMRRTLIEEFNKDSAHVIGQVRRDTALFKQPELKSKPKRGRLRKYGVKVPISDIEKQSFTVKEIKLYNRDYKVHYQSDILMARFLGGKLVRAVWTKLEDIETGSTTKMRLMLSTDCDLTPVVIINAYARRWIIESFFHEVKYSWGLHKAWQQSRMTFARWVQILSAAYFIPSFIIASKTSEAISISKFKPCRAKKNGANKITVGILRDTLKTILTTSDFPTKISEVAKIKGAYYRTNRQNPYKSAA